MKIYLAQAQSNGFPSLYLFAFSRTETNEVLALSATEESAPALYDHGNQRALYVAQVREIAPKHARIRVMAWVGMYGIESDVKTFGAWGAEPFESAISSVLAGMVKTLSAGKYAEAVEAGDGMN